MPVLGVFLFILSVIATIAYFKFVMKVGMFGHHNPPNKE